MPFRNLYVSRRDIELSPLRVRKEKIFQKKPGISINRCGYQTFLNTFTIRYIDILNLCEKILKFIYTYSCTMVQNNQETRLQYWDTCSSVCSLARTAHLFAHYLTHGKINYHKRQLTLTWCQVSLSILFKKRPTIKCAQFAGIVERYGPEMH